MKDNLAEWLPEGLLACSDAIDGSGSSTSVALASLDLFLPIYPAPASGGVLACSYAIDGAGYAGVRRELAVPADWRDQTCLSFWLSGPGSAATLRVELRAGGASAQLASRYELRLVAPDGWRYVSLPLSSFLLQAGQHAALDQPLDLSSVWGYALLVEGPAQGRFLLGPLDPTSGTLLDSFASGLPPGLEIFCAIAETVQMEIQGEAPPLLPVPNQAGALGVSYNTGGWGGGITRDFAVTQDWSGYSGVSLWLKGCASGSAMRFELKADGANPDNANRYELSFQDSQAGWRYFKLPFASFTRRTDHNPGPSPGDPLDTAKIWGYSIIIPGGCSGSLLLEHVGLFGAIGGIKLGFSGVGYSALEGQPATITVLLSASSDQTISVEYTSEPASAGTLLAASRGLLTFEPGVTAQSFALSALCGAEQGDQQLLLSLFNPSGARLGRSRALLTIYSTSWSFHHVGRGSYVDRAPYGRGGPCNNGGAPAIPSVTEDFARLVSSTSWWSSLIWHFWGNPFGENLHALPIAAHFQPAGLALGHPTTCITDGSDAHYRYVEDLRVCVAGLEAERVRVADYSDWSVTAVVQDQRCALKATLGHGFPFVYLSRQGGDVLILFPGEPEIWFDGGSYLGVMINGRGYGIFGPSGCRWATGERSLRSSLNGRDYCSIAALPDHYSGTREELLACFHQHAFAFISETRVSWRYDERSAQLITSYSVAVEVMEGAATASPLLALYRHHWLNSSDITTSYSYSSPRGTLKLLEGRGFTTSMTFGGLVPALPDRGGYDYAKLYGYVQGIVEQSDGLIWQRPGESGAQQWDAYWSGKAFERLSELIWIADQLAAARQLAPTQRTTMAAARERLLGELKAGLQRFLKADDGPGGGMGEPLLSYNRTWRSLIPYPVQHGSDVQLNDHHFVYGYFIRAAATIAHFDRPWAEDSQWGGMIKLLIQDASCWDRQSGMFPFMRCFDPYEGHGWASGPAAAVAGNNQESSSEAMLFNAGVLLFGSVTGDTSLRDLGIFLYVNEMHAIEQYWMDVDGEVFPEGYTRTVAGIIWGDGLSWSTYFSADPAAIHGINMLPMQSGSLYLGRHPGYVRERSRIIRAECGGEPAFWPDVIWMYDALADPATALARFGAGDYTPEWGSTRAQTYHWLHCLSALGQLDTSVTADTPTYNVFVRDGRRTYVAYNPGEVERTVRFSDGTVVVAPPRALVVG